MVSELVTRQHSLEATVGEEMVQELALRQHTSSSAGEETAQVPGLEQEPERASPEPELCQHRKDSLLLVEW